MQSIAMDKKLPTTETKKCKKKYVKFQKAVCDKWLNNAEFRKVPQRLKMKQNALQNRMSKDFIRGTTMQSG